VSLRAGTGSQPEVEPVRQEVVQHRGRSTGRKRVEPVVLELIAEVR
jgi:hypothetical protein